MSKKTDYVNAQFDDAELRIEELFGEIKQESPYGLGGALVAVNTQAGDACTRQNVLIYKKDDTVYLRAVCLGSPGVYLSEYADFTLLDSSYRWAFPPETYRVQDSSNNEFSVRSVITTVQGEVVRSSLFKADYRNRLPVGPLVIKASWQA